MGSRYGVLGTLVLWTMVSMVFVCFWGAGCKKRSGGGKGSVQSVITNRMDDAAYRKTLDENRKVQTAKAGERSVVVEQMKALVEQAKAKLPAGADDEAVKAFLAKDEAWQKLEAKNKQLIGEIEQTLAEARQAVQKRMLEESRAVKAVAEGKAKAAAQTPAK